MGPGMANLWDACCSRLFVISESSKRLTIVGGGKDVFVSMHPCQEKRNKKISMGEMARTTELKRVIF